MGTDEKGKKKYEAPVIVPLGELASAMGKSCNDGSGASSCGVGNMAASGACGIGDSASAGCPTGNSPHSEP